MCAKETRARISGDGSSSTFISIAHFLFFFFFLWKFNLIFGYLNYIRFKIVRPQTPVVSELAMQKACKQACKIRQSILTFLLANQETDIPKCVSLPFNLSRFLGVVDQRVVRCQRKQERRVFFFYRYGLL